MLVSRSKVYLTGDFRLTYKDSKKTWWEDNLDTQKLIPVVKLGWNAFSADVGVFTNIVL
jgi:hypothetical protein